MPSGEALSSVVYEIRRQARGSAPPPKTNLLRRRLLVGGIALGIAGLALGAYLIYRSLAYVTTVRAHISAAVVSLSPEMDARLVAQHVRPGQRVQKGEVLARLDDSALRAALAAAEAGMAIAESRHAQAQADYELIKARIEADIELARVRVEVAAAHVASAKAALELRSAQLAEEERRALAYREEARARRDQVKKGPRSELIEAAEARLATAKARAALAELEMTQIQELVERRIESPLNLEIKKTQLTAQRNEVREAELALARLRAGATPEEMEAAEQVLSMREADLALVRAGMKQTSVLAAELAIREAQQREAEAELKRAESLRLEIDRAEKRVQAAAAELRQASAELEGRRAALESKSIVSPVTGTEIRTLNHEGEVCRRGVPTILVADDAAGRWIEGFVAEEDAARLKVGQPAEVELIVGSGHYVQATLEEVGLTAYSIGSGTAAEDAQSRGTSRLVWVKLKPAEQKGMPLPGMSARAVIRVW